MGATGAVVGCRCRELREARGWTYKETSDRLTAAGRPIPTLGLRKIEALDRRVDADDLVALAVIFDVNVSALLLPSTGVGEVEVTGAGNVSAARAWSWMDGKLPLIVHEGEDEGTAAMAFQLRARPPGRRYRIGVDAFFDLAEETPGYSVVRDADGTTRVVGSDSSADEG